MNHGFSSVLERWARFQTDNSGETLGLILGLGTSGREDPVRLVKVIDQYPTIRWFVLLIDEMYKNKPEEIEESLEPLCTAPYGFQRERSGVSIVHPATHTVVIAWGAHIPTKYANRFSLEQYSKPRNDSRGPYAYGEQCRLYEMTRPFYQPLLDFFQHPRIHTILVYNRAVWNTRLIGYARDPSAVYRGPQFQTMHRIVPDVRRQLLVTENQYFEHMCELLYSLSRSGHPVLALVDNPDGSLEEVPMYIPSQADNHQRGGRRRLTKKAVRRRSYSRRRRTV